MTASLPPSRPAPRSHLTPRRRHDGRRRLGLAKRDRGGNSAWALCSIETGLGSRQGGREGGRVTARAPPAPSPPSSDSACIRYSGGELCAAPRAIAAPWAPWMLHPIWNAAANAAASCLLYHIISALICMCNASPFLSASRRRMIWRLRSRPTAAISMGVVR